MIEAWLLPCWLQAMVKARAMTLEHGKGLGFSLSIRLWLRALLVLDGGEFKMLFAIGFMDYGSCREPLVCMYRCC